MSGEHLSINQFFAMMGGLMLSVLKKIGLSDKEIAVYTALLQLGSSSVRQVALTAKVNRGTAYDILKSLMADGLVSYVNKETKHFFTAENPMALTQLVRKKQTQLDGLVNELAEVVPALQSLHKKGGEKPVVRYFEGERGIKTLLHDVLDVMARAKEKTYFVFSASTIRDHYHRAYPKFTADRIKKKIRVRAIAMGPGGERHGLDERRWLTKNESAPTYSLIYDGHIAHIALDTGGQMVGVIIENQAMYESQKVIFNALWPHLK